MWPTLPGVGEQKERMLRGELYRYDDPDLTADHIRLSSCSNASMRRAWSTPASDAQSRGAAGRDRRGRGDRARFLCDYGYQTTVGEGTFINYGAIFLDCAPITVGRHCQVATNVQLLAATHPLDPGPRRDGWESAHPIVIEDGVWLGGGAIVCPGVTIGEDTVVGAGSVVVEDLPSGVLAVGSPCRPIRELG